MAQEWNSAFGNDGIGIIGCDTLLTTADVDGIAYIAIKALEKRTTEQNNLLLKQQQTIDELKKELSQSKEINVKLNEKLDIMNEKITLIINNSNINQSQTKK
jgi:hypothetical protein